MNPIEATVRDGRLDIQVPADWPDGTRVEIQPIGRRDDVMTAEEIAQTLAAMDRIEPVKMPDDAPVSLAAEGQSQRDWEKSHFAQRAEKLRRGWTCS